MRNYREQSFEMSPLKEVRWEAQAQGNLVHYVSHQTYCNNESEDIEITYNFPLPYGSSVLCGLSATVNGVTKNAIAVEKVKAERKYEEAIAEGDSPLMIEVAERDFCTASLGNLRPGETAEIRVEYLQVLQFCDGKARLIVPLVLDDRFTPCDAQAPDGRSEVSTSIFANYGLSGRLRLTGDLSNAEVTSPSSQIKLEKYGDRSEVSLGYGSKVDRDLVLDISLPASEARPIEYKVKSGDLWYTVASFPGSSKDLVKKPLSINILVDCSGSMHGARIENAVKALQQVRGQFQEDDIISLACFGSGCEIRMNQLRWSDLQANTQYLREVRHIKADLGGTELAGALETLRDGVLAKETSGLQKVVLIITDGETWGEERILAIAGKLKAPIFALGIGVAPYHDLLSSIAEQSKGAYTTIYDESDIARVVDVMTQRMRFDAGTVKVEFSGTPIFKQVSPNYPRSVDSVVATAIYSGEPESTTDLIAPDGSKVSGQIENCPFGEALVKLCAQQQLVACDDGAEKAKIARKHNLASSVTNLLLVVERSAADKAGTTPALRLVDQMPVADRFWDRISSPIDSIKNILFSKRQVCLGPIRSESFSAPIYETQKVSVLTRKQIYEIQKILKKNYGIKKCYRLVQIIEAWERGDIDDIEKEIQEKLPDVYLFLVSKAQEKQIDFECLISEI